MIRHGWRFALLTFVFLLLGTACDASAPLTPTPTLTADAPGEERPLRLFIVRSYGAGDAWSDRVRVGILEALAQNGYDLVSGNLLLEECALYAELTSRDPEALEKRKETLIRKIQDFGADIVILVDDEAARWILESYPDPAQRFVLCGLSDVAWGQGLERANAVGVLDFVHPVETVRLAASMMRSPPKEVLFLSDASLSGVTEAAQVRTALSDAEEPALREVLTRSVDGWETWQEVILEEVPHVDLVLLGRYSALVDAGGVPVPQSTVLRWTLQNSPEPIFGLHLHAIESGVAGGLVASGYEQGRKAAELTLDLLRGVDAETRSPQPAQRNVLAINIAAAQYWDLDASVEVLLAARVVRYFPIALGGP